MKPIEAYVKKWYDYLAEGKIMGMKCQRCGAYEFPPVPVCNHCSSTDLKWVEMSGKGEMVSISATTIVEPAHEEYGQIVHALVHLAEGPTFISWLMSVRLADQADIFEKLPAPVQMETHKREKYSYPVFRMVES